VAEFLVKVADERGHVQERVDSGSSESELRDRYSRQGFHVYSVKTRGLFAAGDLGGRGRRIKLADFVVFNQQFLTLFRAGLPILAALDLLVSRQRSAGLRSRLENVRDRVKTGESLSDAFAAQNAFPRIFTTTLLAGEKSGNLEEVLERYIHFQRLAMTFRKKLTSSLIYPSLLVTMVIIMLIFLVTYVVPQFAELYDQLGSNLPAATVFMLAIGEAAQNYFPIIAVVLVALVIFMVRWRTTETGAHFMDRFRMRLPLLGGIWLKYQMAVFARMLSTLLAGGLPLVPSLETAGASMQSRLIASRITLAVQRVREGQPLSRSLHEVGTFPDLAVEMIEVGESTGALPNMLNSVAEFYEEDVENALSAAMSLIEPIILIFMGGVVAFVLISLYLPIFSLGSGINR
jgi:type IV pilus assembly protein PilC